MTTEHPYSPQQNCAAFIPIFSGLKEDELEKINNLIKTKQYSKGSILFSTGDAANHLYIVRHGLVKVYLLSKEERQQIVRMLKPGEFFGDLALFTDKQHYVLNAECVEDSLICLLSRSDFKTLIFQNPHISLQILQAVTNRLAYAEALLSSFTLQNAEQRVSSWLLAEAERSGIASKDGIVLSLTMPRRDIANMLGTTPETLSRKLSKLQAEGVITVSGSKGLIVHDKAKLAALADKYGNSEMRTVNSQNIILANIADSNIQALLKEKLLTKFTPAPKAFAGYTVTCTGSKFCNFALVETKAFAVKLNGSVPAHLTAQAIESLLKFYLTHRQADETFRQYVHRTGAEVLQQVLDAFLAAAC